MIVSDFRYTQDLILRRRLDEVGTGLFYVEKDYTVEFRLDGLPVRFVVPAGTWTDFASIPRLVPSLIAQRLDAIEPAVIHDYMCQVKPVWGWRVAADVFGLALAASEVPGLRRQAMHKAVMLFGPRW